ncbi:MAG TPA: glutamate 5-kinase [Phaeodactylibacter sp.]|nr:glutamate 5-kinase [Phaeodactylibacter sp.]
MHRPVLVLKIGSSTLTKGSDRISRGKLEDLARQIRKLRKSWRIVLVSSGAIAAARQQVAMTRGPGIGVKQALAAIGQPMLMRMYHEIFRDFDISVAQCLLTHPDFEQETSRQNTRTTLNTLLVNDYLPIVNENDTVATEEIKFGDNDRLAAQVAVLLEARLLVLISDIDGLYDGDPRKKADARLIPEVRDLEAVLAYGSESGSQQGSGGMRSKLEAAAICRDGNVEMWILKGEREEFLQAAFAGQMAFTRFLP